MVDIVCVGHILHEEIIFPYKVVSPVLGSPVAYSSACMAKLGVKVGIVTKIGPDFPEELLKVFNEIGVDTKGIIQCKTSTNNQLIYDKDGNKTLKFLTKADNITFYDIPKDYLDAYIYYICPMDYEIDIENIKKIYELKKIMAVDLGGYGGGTSAFHPKIKDGKEIRKLSSHFNLVKASLEDLKHIFGEEMSENTVADKIINWGAGAMIITLGENGSYVKNNNLEKYIPPYHIEKLVDQTGAGDCFFAGFLTNYLKHSDPFQSAAYGNATSSYIVERSGGVVPERMPSIGEVEKRLVSINI